MRPADSTIAIASATCQNTNGSAICTCPANYVGDGVSRAIGGTGCAGALQRTMAGLLVNVSFDATTIQAKASELMAGNLVRVANARFRGEGSWNQIGKRDIHSAGCPDTDPE